MRVCTAWAVVEADRGCREEKQPGTDGYGGNVCFVAVVSDARANNGQDNEPGNGFD